MFFFWQDIPYFSGAVPQSYLRGCIPGQQFSVWCINNYFLFLLDCLLTISIDTANIFLLAALSYNFPSVHFRLEHLLLKQDVGGVLFVCHMLGSQGISGKERVGQIERPALKCMCCRVWARQLVGSCCAAWGAQPGLCDDLQGWDGEAGGRLRREGIYVCLRLIPWWLRQ